MADSRSIKDLPDPTKIDQGKKYLVSGEDLITIYSVLKQLWRGENVGKGPKIRLRSSGTGGYTISGADQSSPPATSPNAKTTPFQIFTAKHLVSGVWDNTYDVTLYPGNINQLLPTNIFSTINSTITGTKYVILTVLSDGYAITSSTWSLVDTMPAPPEATADTPPSSFTVLIGVIFYNTGTTSISVFQQLLDNVTAAPAEWTRTTRAGAGPFELAYVIYYTWAIAS